MARPIIVAFLSLLSLWVLAMSVSPRLHERIHTDAGRAEHSCAITLISSGTYEHVMPGPVVAVERPTFGEQILLPLTTVRVALFHAAALLEHAPPAHF
jgi:hypothetical protein